MNVKDQYRKALSIIREWLKANLPAEALDNAMEYCGVSEEVARAAWNSVLNNNGDALRETSAERLADYRESGYRRSPFARVALPGEPTEAERYTSVYHAHLRLVYYVAAPRDYNGRGLRFDALAAAYDEAFDRVPSDIAIAASQRSLGAGVKWASARR